MKRKQQKDALARAIEMAGSQELFALRVGVSQQSVSLWVKNGKVPAERVVDAEDATGGKITRRQFRPDLFTEQAP
jgi:DNA-binding transcriptional regulator YdaS (Cro superfamily)